MQVTIAPARFAQSLAAARAAETKASHALSQALLHVKPIDADLHEMFLTKPEMYAATIHKVADIVADLPRLREEAKRTLDILSDIEIHQCDRCGGTGVYPGASNATRNGYAYCFYCNGTGDARVPSARSARRAATSAN